MKYKTKKKKSFRRRTTKYNKLLVNENNRSIVIKRKIKEVQR